jgi:hypothetical protein
MEDRRHSREHCPVKHLLSICEESALTILIDRVLLPQGIRREGVRRATACWRALCLGNARRKTFGIIAKKTARRKALRPITLN